MECVQTAIAKVRETPFHARPAGIACMFVAINDRWGVKLYRDKQYADKTYNMQKKAAEFRLAPNVGERLTINDYDKYGHACTLHGYLTESIVFTHAQVHNLSSKTYYDGDNKAKWIEASSNLQCSYEYMDLIDGIRKKAGIDPCDMHMENVGYLDDGTLVAIDFSECDWE